MTISLQSVSRPFLILVTITISLELRVSGVHVGSPLTRISMTMRQCQKDEILKYSVLECKGKHATVGAGGSWNRAIKYAVHTEEHGLKYENGGSAMKGK